MSRIIALFGSSSEPNMCYNRLMRDEKWVWQHPDWPQFQWDDGVISPIIQKVRFNQGVLQGMMAAPSDEANNTNLLNALVENLCASSAIEGERVDPLALRSSLAKRLQIASVQTAKTHPEAEGLSEMAMDVLTHSDAPLTLNRLLQWHAWLFPKDVYRLNHVEGGALRGHAPMQVVSGRWDNPTIHYEAPPRSQLEHDLTTFIDWFNATQTNNKIEGVVRAAVAHVWFELIHPFEDGNGRIGRLIIDLALLQANDGVELPYSFASIILAERKQYYRELERIKQLDITEWIVWFLHMLISAIQDAIHHIERALQKIHFWQCHDQSTLLPEQIKVINRLLEGGEMNFEQGINASQYQKVAKVSKATATRHLSQLVEKDYLVKLPGGGRSTRYHLRPIATQYK